ncbi:FtsX-like permease family protein [Clostridium baratii]|uniref:FtsX-like permease family protein n=1 Tax=Clostridium baratii TaxID=1561 RepID=UPI0005F2E7B8|nr:FtsX-like permease family protein [Clostridium baratii]KJU72194.1 ABC transporter [Clostridium baratii]
MYSKLAINNVRKSFKDYTIYFLTLTFAVCIFYSFNSISAQSTMSVINDGKSDAIKLISMLMSYLSVFVSVVLGCLIIYANNFLIKRRKKELGLYMSLGMGKGKISKLLVLEELIIGIFSLVAGILLGLVASQGLSVITAKLFDISLKNYKFVVSVDGIIKTAIYFGIIYILVMIFNTIIISKYKLIDLLTAHKKNEKIKIKNPIIAGIIFIVSLIMLGTAYYLVNKVGLDVRTKEFQMSILLGIVGTAAFFYGLTTFLIMVIQKNKRLYLKKLNIFTLRQMNSKINTNFVSMTVICLMLFLTISMLSVGVSFKKQNVDSNMPFDMTAYTYDIKDNNVSLESMLNKNGFKIQKGDKYAYVTIYKGKESLKDILSKYATGKNLMSFSNMGNIDVMSISDFNKVRELKGEEPITLNNDSVLIQSNASFTKPEVDKFMENNTKIKLQGKEYNIANKKLIQDANATTGMSDIFFNVIVPDSLIKGLTPSTYYLNINYGKGNYDSSEKYYTNFFKDPSAFKDGFILANTKTELQQQMQLSTTVILYITLYLGVIFLISSAAVLALQQLSEASDSADRYNSLRRIGASEKMINRSIFAQTLIYFALPLVLAIVHSIVGIYQANAFISAFGNSSIITASLATMGVIIVIYGGYFIATYFGYKNIVKKF